MSTSSKSLPWYLSLAILLGGTLPLVFYWPAFSRVSSPDSLLTLNISGLEQWLVVLTAFGVKPAYMLLSLVLIAWLWKRQAADLVALRWGLIFFLGGEAACAVNYLVFAGCSALADYLHSYGMAVGFSWVTFASLEGADLRLIKYSAPKDRCAALSLCRSCIKYADVPCGLRRLFSFLIPALVVVCMMLPCAELHPSSMRARVLNSSVEFQNPLWSQVFEGRYCAWVAIALLLASWAVLCFKRREPVATAKILFAAAMGPLGFGTLRLFLRSAYRENLPWANVWEELTELIFVAGVGVVLWIFREALFRKQLVSPLAQDRNEDPVQTAAEDAHK